MIWCHSVGLPFDIIEHILIILADVKPIDVYFMFWLMLLPNYFMADLIAMSVADVIAT